jgi:voltage-gated potassium channel
MFFCRAERFVRTGVVARPMASLLCFLVVAYLATTITIMVAEGVDLREATLMTMPAFLGELGGVQSASVATQAAIMGSLLISIAFLAIVTAKATTVFVEFCRRGGSIVDHVSLSDHVIICGWNFQGERIVRELLASDMARAPEVVVLADRECRPVRDDRAEFVRGDPTQDADLKRAGVERANSVIVLTDTSKGPNEADAEALMIVLAVESLNRRAHTTVQILNAGNRIHLERAHADEIICLDQMGGSLAVAAAMNHGVSRVITELLTFNAGSEFYRYDRPLSADLVGRTFAQAGQQLAGRHVILIAVETTDGEDLRAALPDQVFHPTDEGARVIVVNPKGAYALRQGDALFVVADSEPLAL